MANDTYIHIGELADYRFNVHYRPGKSNGDADGLSRMPQGLDQIMKEYTAEVSHDLLQANVQMVSMVDSNTGWLTVLPTSTRMVDIDSVYTSSRSSKPEEKIDVRFHQLRDPDIRPIIRWKEMNTVPTQAERATQSHITKRLL